MMHALGLTRSVSRQFEMQIMLVQQNGVGQIPASTSSHWNDRSENVNGMKRFTRVASSHTSLEKCLAPTSLVTNQALVNMAAVSYFNQYDCGDVT